MATKDNRPVASQKYEVRIREKVQHEFNPLMEKNKPWEITDARTIIMPASQMKIFARNLSELFKTEIRVNEEGSKQGTYYNQLRMETNYSLMPKEQ
jgi:hypothetical protein